MSSIFKELVIQIIIGEELSLQDQYSLRYTERLLKLRVAFRFVKRGNHSFLMTNMCI